MPDAPEVLLITGGSRGIGAATARLAAAHGYAVAITYLANQPAVDALVAELTEASATAIAIRADAASEADTIRAFDTAEQQLGPITALVNNAAIDHHSPVADLDASELERLLAVNVTGTMLGCREAVRRMAHSRGGLGGAIVNVSSMDATIGGRPGAAAYAATKAAVDAFTIGIAREVADDGIRVNALRPGMTRTDMTDYLEDPTTESRIASTIPMNRIATPDEIAAPILWLLSEEASFISGACLDASGAGFWIGRRDA
ncbi:MAG: SDR family oxidoreductase [Dehalococcoidia bacterium]|jgi:NAD(P)-dependent dehydrogenase (short-subunit alcohol dehydrogenase family)|nr:SDR family oxidoreductase [Dehalococcoidia bacterium]